MKRTLILWSLFFLCLFACQRNSYHVESPDKSLLLSFFIDDKGQAYYQLNKGDKVVINPSQLGFILSDSTDLSIGFKCVKKSHRLIQDTIPLHWGNESELYRNYNQYQFDLENDYGYVSCIFRLFNEGLGFRMITQRKDQLPVIISDELTTFAISNLQKAWWIPVDYDSYEKFYTESGMETIDSAETPFTFHTGDGLAVSIHEAAIENYSSMTLIKNQQNILHCNLVPWPDGTKVKGGSTVITPWRTIQIGNNDSDLLNSRLIEMLNEPPKSDFSWVKPAKYCGIWWDMHLGTLTWFKGEHHGATTAYAKELIDFAANNKLQAVLIEGWNKGWEEWKNWSYTESYDDYDMEYLATYAREKGITLIAHNETAGYVDEYEKQLDIAFEYYSKLGISYVKTGYVGSIKNGQYHHGQWMIDHYNRVIKTAARYGIGIIAHEAIKPSGLHITYPNLLATEAARGQEYNAPWAPENNPPEHSMILPFTRMLAGPMDFTPGLFNIQYGNNDKHGNTTLSKQLAMYVVFSSPIQMACDLPQNYNNHLAFTFIRQVPVNWQKSIVLEANIGNYITMVKKDRGSQQWFLGSMTNQNARELEFECNFLDNNKKYKAIVYADAEESHYLQNPTAYRIKELSVRKSSFIRIKLAPGGGAAILFIPEL